MKASLILILSVLLFLAVAQASELRPTPNDPANTIITFSQFKKLTSNEQQDYISGLQILVADLAKEDLSQNTQYQSAQNLLSWLMPDAVADGEAARCIYAGWLSYVVNGRCILPSTEGSTCAKGRIPCSPVLYGANNCVMPTGNATLQCEKQKKPLAKIISEIKATVDQDGWDTFRSHMAEYCNKPLPKQVGTCTRVRAQLARIARHMPTLTSSSGQAMSTAGANATAPTTSTRTLKTIESLRTDGKAPGGCDRAQLVSKIRPQGPGTWGEPIMDFVTAQSLMCKTTGAVDQAAVENARARILTARRAIVGKDKWSNNDRSDADNYMKNLNSCVALAQSIRAGNNVPDTRGNSGTFVVNGSFVDVYDASGKIVATKNPTSDFEALIGLFSLSFCNVRTQSDAGTPVYSSPSTASPASGVQ